MEEFNPTGGYLVARGWQLLRANVRFAALSAVIIASIGILADLASKDGAGLNGAANLVALYLQYETTQRVLADLNLIKSGQRRRRIWAMIGLSIVSGLATLAGFVLLIVPGVILAVRWSVAVPALIGEDVGVFESLRRSWRATDGRFWPISQAFLIAYIPIIGALLVAVVLDAFSDLLPMAIAINLALSGSQVFGWYVVIAIYAAGNMEPRLAEVFA